MLPSRSQNKVLDELIGPGSISGGNPMQLTTSGGPMVRVESTVNPELVQSQFSFAGGQ